MADSFDPYHKWLGISPKDQPPNHYRLLAIERFESDPDVIEGAADRQMAHVRTFQTGQNSALSQRILNELSAARLCLLNPEKKAAYDRQLREKIAEGSGSRMLQGSAHGQVAQPGYPQAGAPGRGEGVSPRSLPQAKPLPITDVPMIVADSSSSSSSIRKQKRGRKAPLWQQPLALGAFGAVVLLACAVYFLTGRGKEPSQTVATSKATSSVAAPKTTGDNAPAKKTVDRAPKVTTPPPSVATSASGEPDFEILDATWGAGDKWVNVADGVRGLVKDSRLMMMAWGNLLGSPKDPVPGTAKKLRLQYRSRGQRYSVEYPEYYFIYLDGNPLAPPTDSPGELELVEARYGAGKSYLDVLPQLREHLRDGRLKVSADFAHQKDFVPEGWDAEKWANAFKVLWVRYRTNTGEHFTYAWNASTLVIDARLPEQAGPPVDLLKLIEVPRDVVYGDWSINDGQLLAPAQIAARVEIPYEVSEDYVMNVVAEADGELSNVSAGLVVGGRQVLANIDDGGGSSAMSLINGVWHGDDKNPTKTWRLAHMLEQGRPNLLTFIVRPTSVRVLRDGAELLRWSGDFHTFSIPKTWEARDPRRLYLQSYNVRYRITNVELAPLKPEASPMLFANQPGVPVDAFKAIDPDRDPLRGNWQFDGETLISPSSAHGRFQIPVLLPADYRLDMVAQRESGADGLIIGFPVAGRQASLPIDAFQGKLSGLERIDGKRIDANETKYEGSIFGDGKPHSVSITVQGNHVRLLCDDKPIVDWAGDVNRLTSDHLPPYKDRIFLEDWYSRYRLTKIELTPLSAAAEGKAPPTLARKPLDLPKLDPKKPAASLLKIFEDEPEFVGALKLADLGAQAVLVSDEAYSGKASVKVTPSQRYSEALPGLDVKIRKRPTAPGEYRYLRFAWKKRGGQQIWLQLHHPGNWFRYRAGPNQDAGWAGVRVADELPNDFVVVTRDLAADFGEFALNGIALTPFDGQWACFDHIYLARSLSDFDSIETPPAKPAERKFSDLVSGKSPRVPVPDETAQKQAKQALLKKLAAAKSAEQKRTLAQQFMEEASLASSPDANVYVLLSQAVDLAEACGDLDLAWQAIDQLASTFAIKADELRQKSLTEIAKTAKSPERCRELVDSSCRLLVSALVAGEAEIVKKTAAQAQSLAKRTKDKTLQKDLNGRAAGANRLATELEAVEAARETLKSMPDDAHANSVAGHWQLCVEDDWEPALLKLAKGDDAGWKKLAADSRPLVHDISDPNLQITTADAWWEAAEKEPWPGRHYLRLHAANWYRLALPSLMGEKRNHADQRLKLVLATDEGLPAWELFNFSGGQSVGGFKRITRGGAMRTHVDYDGPIDVTFVARTDSLNIRLVAYDRDVVIWNWELNPSELRVERPNGGTVPVPVKPLEPNRWYEFHYRITRHGTTITVDGIPVFTENRAYSKFPRGPVGVTGAGNAVVDVKKFVVRAVE